MGNFYRVINITALWNQGGVNLNTIIIFETKRDITITESKLWIQHLNFDIYQATVEDHIGLRVN